MPRPKPTTVTKRLTGREGAVEHVRRDTSANHLSKKEKARGLKPSETTGEAEEQSRHRSVLLPRRFVLSRLGLAGWLWPMWLTLSQTRR